MIQYTTSELTKLCGTTVRTVRFHDPKGLLEPECEGMHLVWPSAGE